jgi:hypothetical protein
VSLFRRAKRERRRPGEAVSIPSSPSFSSPSFPYNGKEGEELSTPFEITITVE